MWRPEATSVRSWREGSIFLGRIPSAFQILFHSQRSQGQRGDVAIDQLEFLDCALPGESHQVNTGGPNFTYIWVFDEIFFSLSLSSSASFPGECPAGMMRCNNEACVEERQACDGTDDCGDGTDELNCGEWHKYQTSHNTNFCLLLQVSLKICSSTNNHQGAIKNFLASVLDVLLLVLLCSATVLLYGLQEHRVILKRVSVNGI